MPIGGTEQNGAHMVLGKHNVRAHVLADRIADALGNAIVAPTIAYVPEGSIHPPAAHMKYTGTISVPDAVFEGLLEAAARCSSSTDSGTSCSWATTAATSPTSRTWTTSSIASGPATRPAARMRRSSTTASRRPPTSPR